MYINDTHILVYVIIGLAGILVGQFIDWCNKRMSDYKTVFSKEIFTEYFRNFKPNYILISITLVMFLGLVYFFGVTIDLFKYLFLTPMLLIAFCIDYKLQIIPNRLTLTMFETGLAFTFIQVVANTSLGINVLINNLLGMLVGGGIFLLITIIGGFIAGKEAMGFGDVKLMGALGLFLGWPSIIIVAVISFLLAAIISIGILIVKKKGTNEYIPFGPFIVVSTLIVIFIPFDLLLTIILKIFTLGTFKGKI